MKKFIVHILLGLSLVSFFPVTAAHAQVGSDINQYTGSFAQAANLQSSKDPRSLAAQIIKIFLGIVGTLCLVYGIYAGYLVMTAGGESEKIDQAKGILKNSVIGLLLCLSSLGIVILLQKVFLAENSRNIKYDENGNELYEYQYENQSQDYTGCTGDDPLNPHCQNPYLDVGGSNRQ